MLTRRSPEIAGIGPNEPETAKDAEERSRNEVSVASGWEAVTPTGRSHRRSTPAAGADAPPLGSAGGGKESGDLRVSERKVGPVVSAQAAWSPQ